MNDAESRHARPAVALCDARVAVVHDWLTVYSGAERVTEQILQAFPDADLFAVIDFLPDELRGFVGDRRARTTFIQNLPGARWRYRSYLPLMPLAIERLDLSRYDLVLSSSHAVAKGVRTGPGQLHISYVHTPMRYAWDLQAQYLRAAGLDRGAAGWLTKWFLHRLQNWDRRTAQRVDHFIANSRFIRERIQRCYERDAQVIYPPVDVEGFTPGVAKEAFYLTASRLVPYKRIGLIVEAFASLRDRRLIVVGDGPELQKVRALAGPNVELLGYRGTVELRDLMQRARAFLFAAEEDFGIVPVEAQASGTPVIAYDRGGAAETVRGLDDPQPTGVFFREQSVTAIASAIREFERSEARITAAACRRNALQFSTPRFRTDYAAFVADAWLDFSTRTEMRARTALRARDGRSLRET